MRQIATLIFISVLILSVPGWSQSTTTSGTAQTSANQSTGPVTIPLADALDRARKLNPQFQSAVTDAGVAHEDKVQARAALLPGVNYAAAAIYTQPSLLPNATLNEPRFIAANGVREYISQGIAQENLSFASIADFRRAHAAEALARTRREIALRGLNLVVVQAYYNAIVAGRKTGNAQAAADESQHFLKVSQDLEHGGEVAHSDVLKAQLQANDRARELEEARLAEEKAKLDLAVLITRDFTTDFSLVDDLRFAPPLPEFAQAQTLAEKNNPELRAALQSLQVANNEVWVAIGGHLPVISAGYAYGIDAAQFATHTNGASNLGYSASASFNLPIWSWGATQSKVKQATLLRSLARTELSAAQRQAIASLKADYDEARLAHAQLDLLRNSADMAAESLRLTTLRYQGGEATALEVVDAQNTLTTARNAYDDGEVRYRVAVATLQTLTGPF